MLVSRPRPVTDQVVTLLDDRIRGGHYTAGQRLPSEAELAEELGVSRNTIRTALTRLATAGLIVRKHGAGTFVRQMDRGSHSLVDAVWEYRRMIEDTGRTPSIQGVAVSQRTASAEEAKSLRLAPGDEVISVERVFYADEIPIILSSNTTPADFFLLPSAELDISLGMHEFLERFCQQRVAYANVKFKAVLADQRAQQMLAVKAATPLIQIQELFFNINDQPIVYALNLHHDTALKLQNVRPWYE